MHVMCEMAHTDYAHKNENGLGQPKHLLGLFGSLLFKNLNISFLHAVAYHKNLCTGTDRSKQTVQTQPDQTAP